MTKIPGPSQYPVHLDVLYSEQQVRWKALLRLPLSIPVLIFSTLLQGGVVLAIWAAILVKGQIPDWLFTFQITVNQWQLRTAAYFLLLTDQYPPFEGDYPIRYSVHDVERRSRRKLIIWKLATAIPHFFLLFVLSLTLLIVVPIAWVTILITGRFPLILHRYVANVLRWAARVQAYILSLTDVFPPFRLAEEAEPAGRVAYRISSIIAILAISLYVLFISFVISGLFEVREVRADVSYQRLVAGEARSEETRVIADSREGGPVNVELRRVVDPANEIIPFLAVRSGYRFIHFELALDNSTGDDLDLANSKVRLTDANGTRHETVLLTIDGRLPPRAGFTIIESQDGEGIRLIHREFSKISEDTTAVVELLFELPDGVAPVELRFRLANRVNRTVIYEFR